MPLSQENNCAVISSVKAEYYLLKQTYLIINPISKNKTI